MNSMNQATFRELLEKCLEGIATPEEQDQVVQACQSQPEFARMLDEALAMDASLQALRHDKDRFVSALLARITRKGESSRFAQAVRGKLEPGAPEQADPAGQPADATGLHPDIRFATGIQKFVKERKSSKRMRKASGRRGKTVTQRPTSWTWIPTLLAACVLVGVTLYLTVFNRKDPLIDVGQTSDPIGEVVWVRQLTKAEFAPVLVREVDGTPKERELKANDSLYPGDRVRTKGQSSDAPAARAAIRMKDGTEVDLAEATALRVTASSEVELEMGHIYVEAVSGFRVEAELVDLEVEDGNARFDFRAETEQAYVRLKEGRAIAKSVAGPAQKVHALHELVASKDGTIRQNPIELADIWTGRKTKPDPVTAGQLVFRETFNGINRVEDLKGWMLVEWESGLPKPFGYTGWKAGTFDGRPGLRAEPSDKRFVIAGFGSPDWTTTEMYVEVDVPQASGCYLYQGVGLKGRPTFRWGFQWEEIGMAKTTSNHGEIWLIPGKEGKDRYYDSRMKYVPCPALPANQTWALRARINRLETGYRLRAKRWAVSGQEPQEWLFDVTDDDPTYHAPLRGLCAIGILTNGVGKGGERLKQAQIPVIRRIEVTQTR